MTVSHRRTTSRGLILLGMGLAAALLLGAFAVRHRHLLGWTPTTAAAAAGPLRIGYRHTPLLAPLFFLAEQDKGVHYRLVPFLNDEEQGIALDSGHIDVAFFDPAAGERLLTQRTPEQPALRVAGAIEYPYGVTLVVRKGFHQRLTELAGSTIGAGEPDCRLLQQFRRDAKTLGADLRQVRFTYLPDDALAPALLAGKLDGAVVKTSTALLAVANGASILYQNANVSGHDACCPRWTTQVDSLLLVAPGRPTAVADLTRRLEQVGHEATREDLNRAVARFTAFPSQALEESTVIPTYKPLRGEARQQLAPYLWSEQ